MKFISLKFILRILLCLIFIAQFALALILLKYIAFVITTRAAAMLAPISFAQPTKLMPTPAGMLSARHMVATLILFNVHFAFGTAFRLRHNPRNILRFARAFGEPLSARMATRREMRIILACPTKAMPACIARNLFRHAALRREHNVTIFTRAKAKFFGIFDKILAAKSAISLIILRIIFCQKHFPYFLRYGHIAFGGRTRQCHALFGLHFVAQVVDPTFFASI